MGNIGHLRTNIKDKQRASSVVNHITSLTLSGLAGDASEQGTQHAVFLLSVEHIANRTCTCGLGSTAALCGGVVAKVPGDALQPA